MDEEARIVYLPALPVPQPAVLFKYAPFRGSDTPIIIDNGSTNLRYGLATENPKAKTARLNPFAGSNTIARYRDRKTYQQVLVFGESVEYDSGARSMARTPWEGDVLLNFDALEHALDYVFLHMGIDTEASVNHPILMSERLCSPLHSRQYTSELMYELYGVPKLLYCVDSMMSLYNNNRPQPTDPYTTDGLVISFNTASTSIVPILSGRGILSQCKRIPWGSMQAAEYLQKIIQLKYPSFPTKLTMPQATWLFQNVCSLATDYTELLRTLRDPIQLRAHERIIQFPFTAVTKHEKTEEELASAAERKRAQGRRLQEMAAEKRKKKLAEKEEYLRKLRDLADVVDRAIGLKEEYMSVLKRTGYKDQADLLAELKKIENDVSKREDDEATFPLVDIDDEELTPEQLKEKRSQKWAKASWEARQRARKEKERERGLIEAEENREAAEREQDLSGWAGKLRVEHEATMARMKERARQKAALSDRKSAAAQNRMKNITSLAADDRVQRKRRKTASEDTFGATDEDWAVYRKINRSAAESDEEEDAARLSVIEAKLLQHDPSFEVEHTYAALLQQRSALFQAFQPAYPDDDPAGAMRIHLSTERWRACETWFNPGMAGVDASGLGEVIQNILAGFSNAEKERLVKNVFVTGAPAQLPELVPRLHSTIRPILPPEMPLHVQLADNPSLDAWRGMAHCSLRPDVWSYAVTNAEYQEWGGERIRRWWGGNWNSSFVDESLTSSL